MVETLSQLIQHTTPHLAWVLIHSLWQAAAIALGLWALLRCIPAGYARARYTACLLALTTVVALSVGTHAWLIYTPTAITSNAQAVTTPTAITPTTIDSATLNTQTAPQSSVKTPGKAGTLHLTHTWSITLCTAWLIGFLVMFLRTVGGLRHASRLRIESKVPPLWLAELLAELARKTRYARRVAVRVCDDLTTPAALGLLQPLIVLPPSIVQGDPVTLRVILLHELAHLRGHDYLVNLVQSLIEAMLFFNPAVWWIGQHIRLEREARCDAVAARAMDNKPEDVARALGQTVLAMHRQTWPSAGALAWAQPLRESKNQGIANRIRRLIDPRTHVAGPVPWHLLAVLLIVIAGVVAVFHQTTSVMIAAVLDGNKHVEQVEQIAKEYGSPWEGITHDSPKATIAGGLVTPDGTAPTGRTNVLISSEGAGNGNSAYGISLKRDGTFHSDDIPAGRVTVLAWTEGFAPSVLGPFDAMPGETIDDLVIQLQPGHEVTFVVTNSEGKPIPDVKIKTTLWVGNSGTGGQPIAPTDDQGRTTLRTQGNMVFELKFTAKGYQFFKQRYVPKPGETITLTLQPSRPSHGQIIDAATNKPIANAQLRLVDGMNSGGNDPRRDYGRRNEPDAVTDADGKYTLDGLPVGEDCSYWIEAEGYRPQVVWGIQAGQDDRVIRLFPKIELTVNITGPLDRLTTDKQGKPIISYSQSMIVKPHHSSSGGGKTQVTPTDTGGVALLDQYILDSKLSITAGPRTVNIANPATVQGPIEIDLRPEADPVVIQRQVILKLHAPEGWPEPTGTMDVQYVSKGSYSGPGRLPIEDGQVTLGIPLSSDTPGKLRYGPIKAAGYWVAEEYGIEVPPGDPPLVIDVPLVPAGTIYGQVVDKRGEPATDVRLSVTTIDPPDLPKNQRIDPNDYNNIDLGIDGRFVIGGLPLSGRYRVEAHDSRIRIVTRVFADPVTLDTRTPTHDVQLVMPVGTDITTTVLDPDGVPLKRAKIRIHYQDKNRGYGSSLFTTDFQGRTVIHGVNLDLSGEYQISVEPFDGYAGTTAPLKHNNLTPTLKLKPGLELHGILLDDTTGLPLPNREVRIHASYQSQAIYKGQLQSHSDADGRFVFRGLEAAAYQFTVLQTAPAGSKVVTLPDGRHQIHSPRNGWVNANTIEISENTKQPYELRVVPY